MTPSGRDELDGSWVRLDLLHVGGRSADRYLLQSQRLVKAGVRPYLRDADERGEYRWVLQSNRRGRCVASLGFSPLFGEWRSTLEDTDAAQRTFSERLYCPRPHEPSRLSVQKRLGAGQYETLLSVALDPVAGIAAEPRARATAALAQGVDISEIGGIGPSDRRINILLVGDGYRPEERNGFLQDAARFEAALFALSPYRERRCDFNVRALYLPSSASGITDPATGVRVDSPFGAAYGTLGIDRYLLPSRFDRLYDVCDLVACDMPVVLCNSDKFGGGGLFNQYSCIAARARNFEYLVLHEFGHAFAGLADEYYTAAVTYRQAEAGSLDFWEPNVSSLNASGQVKWSHLIAAGVPVPTPWRKQAYEDIMRRYEAARRSPDSSCGSGAKEGLLCSASSLLETEAFAGKLGAFEGAAYRGRGVFRPEVDCLMFSRHSGRFCRVCEQAINWTIDRYQRRSASN